MLSKEVRHRGVTGPLRCGMPRRAAGTFEHNNEFYPDVDDTGQVLLALNKVDGSRASASGSMTDAFEAGDRVDLRDAVPEWRLGERSTKITPR